MSLITITTQNKITSQNKRYSTLNQTISTIKSENGISVQGIVWQACGASRVVIYKMRDEELMGIEDE